MNHQLLSTFEDFSSFGSERWLYMCNHLEMKPVVITELCRILETTKHVALKDAFKNHLLAPLQAFAKTTSNNRASLKALGECWVALCYFLISLYVPDAPVDPSIMQRFSLDFCDEQKTALLREIELQTAFDDRTSGNFSSPITRCLTALLENINDRREHSPSPIFSRKDTSRLHAYWGEVTAFLSTVVAHTKLQSLLVSLDSRDPDCGMREEVLQGSLSAFCHRLDAAYPEYEDVNGPMQLAFSYMRLGLRVTADASRRSESVPCRADIVALTAFPSLQSAKRLPSVMRESLKTNSASMIVSTLAGIALISTAGSHANALDIDTVELCYQQIYGLFSIDQARSKEAAREAQTLYRNSLSDQDHLTDAEKEERDFLTIFPQFEEAVGTEQPRESKTSSQLVTPENVLSIHALHQSIFCRDAYSMDAYSTFFSLRKVETRRIIGDEIRTLPEGLDMDSRAFQLHALQDRLSQVLGLSLNQRKPYDFYFDFNFLEAKKALNVVRNLHTRLVVLIDEWPDQMVLKDILDRCDALLNLDCESSVAKLLSELEQLLIHTQDWEMYASSFNTLKTHQASLTSLIVEWRRLELACWQDLLRTEAKRFADGVSEWWFRLYDVIVKGLLSAIDEEIETSPGHITSYLDRLVPLLDEFMSQGPAGQYNSRLQLLRSFESYVCYLGQTKMEDHALGLRRVQRILHSTRRFYEQFSSNISSALVQQQDKLEQEIREFIKLASWKDVNVHALKQSAQRTHRQLYKSIRKFRDILRQPISTSLDMSLESASTSLFSDTSASTISSTRAPAPAPPNDLPPLSISEKPHLLNLQRTFHNFESLVLGDLSSRISVVSPVEIESLITSIIDHVKQLSTTSIPHTLGAARRTQLQKTLTSRKRKAWSDYMKELKRLGFASNMKPEVLERLRNTRWQREQPFAQSDALEFPSIKQIDGYMYRVEKLLPELRASLPSHHSDINTRDLIKSLMLLESGADMALSSRSWYEANFSREQYIDRTISLLGALGAYRSLEQTAIRLHMALSPSQVVPCGSDYLEYAQHIKSKYYDLVYSLEEILGRAQDDSDKLKLQHLRSLCTTLNNESHILIETVRNLTLTSHPIVLTGTSGLSHPL